MRARIISAVIAIMLLQAVPAFAQSQASLGGLYPLDSIEKTLNTMGTPELIRARRMESESLDYAVLLYQRQGVIIVGMTNYGDRMETILSESPAIMTNDGLKVGDPRALVIEKRGQPEETDSDFPGITEYWYWSQGINFAINDRQDSIENIFVFPTQRTTSGPVERIALPGSQVDVEHEYRQNGQEAFIVGRTKNNSPEPQYGVRVGITLRDEKNRAVDVVFSEVGSLLPNTSMPFKVNVRPRGEWADYSVDVQALSGFGLQKYREVRAMVSETQERHKHAKKLSHISR